METSTWFGLRRVLAGTALLLAVACVGQGSATGAGNSPQSSNPPAAAGTQAAPTGKWGQVQGKSVLSAELKAFKINGKAERVVVTPFQADGQPFKDAVRVEIKEKSNDPWDVQIQSPLSARVEKGDVMLATFYFRTERSFVESAEGDTEFVFELAKEPWTKSVSYPVKSGREWRKVYVRYVAEDSYDPGQAQMIFRLGYSPQTIELGGVTVENFGKQLALADLPVTKITYPGQEANAAWRKAADERIEKLRKGDLTVTVKDKAGKAIEGADVSVDMKKHAFKWGTAVQAELIVNHSNQKYLDTIKELFNFAVLENDLKWQPLSGDWGGGWTVERAKKAVSWLRENGLGVRGHVLVWPSWKNLPKSLKALESDKPKLRAEVRKHIKELMGQMKGTLEQWDVMNEPFDNHDLMDIFGDDVMLEWYQDARATDPGVKLFINDYAILSGGGGTSPHRDHYEKTIKFLLDKGAPVDAIGMQGHFGNALTGPEDLMRLLDRYGKYKKPLYITEYDVTVEDEELAADYTRDLMTTFFSHPQAQGFLMWGFWDSVHWKKNAPLFHQDFSPKPALKYYKDLVFGKWWTKATGKTDAKGVYQVRGFQGDYELSVKKAGKAAPIVKAVLDADGTAVTVTLD